MPLWNRSKMEMEMRDMSFCLPHELLDALIKPGEEESWSSFSPSQSGFRTTLSQWAAHLGIQLLQHCWLCFALWGDSAPNVKKDSLFLLVFSLLNGPCRQRFSICGWNKSIMCQCGWKGAAYHGGCLQGRGLVIPGHDAGSIP